VVETVGLENRCTGNRTGGSNPSPSATQSELQRKSALLPPKYAEVARNLRLCPDKPDCRERTARQRRRSLSRLFSGRHMRSPVSRRALGEYKAITSRGFGHCELTLVGILGRVSGYLPAGRPFRSCADQSLDARFSVPILTSASKSQPDVIAITSSIPNLG
jgi:hypothetical protein